MKTWSRDNPMSTELEHYVFELKSKRTGNEKVKDTSDMVPPAQGGMVAGSVIHGCGGGVGRDGARTQHPSTTWTTAISLSPHTNQDLHLPDLLKPGFPNPYRHDFLFFTQDGYHCYDT